MHISHYNAAMYVYFLLFLCLYFIFGVYVDKRFSQCDGWLKHVCVCIWVYSAMASDIAYSCKRIVCCGRVAPELCS